MVADATRMQVVRLPNVRERADDVGNSALSGHSSWQLAGLPIVLIIFFS